MVLQTDMDALDQANREIWDRETALGWAGQQGDMALAGRLALEIRDWNVARIRAKNEIASRSGGFQDRKLDESGKHNLSGTWRARRTQDVVMASVGRVAPGTWPQPAHPRFLERHRNPALAEIGASSRVVLGSSVGAVNRDLRGRIWGRLGALRQRALLGLL